MTDPNLNALEHRDALAEFFGVELDDSPIFAEDPPYSAAGGSLKTPDDVTVQKCADAIRAGAVLSDKSTSDREFLAPILEAPPAELEPLEGYWERGKSRPRPDYDPRIDHPERYTDGPV